MDGKKTSLCTLYSVLNTVHSVQCTVDSAECTVSCVQYTVHIDRTHNNQAGDTIKEQPCLAAIISRLLHSARCRYNAEIGVEDSQVKGTV